LIHRRRSGALSIVIFRCPLPQEYVSFLRQATYFAGPALASPRWRPRRGARVRDSRGSVGASRTPRERILASVQRFVPHGDLLLEHAKASQRAALSRRWRSSRCRFLQPCTHGLSVKRALRPRRYHLGAPNSSLLGSTSNPPSTRSSSSHGRVTLHRLRSPRRSAGNAAICEQSMNVARVRGLEEPSDVGHQASDTARWAMVRYWRARRPGGLRQTMRAAE